MCITPLSAETSAVVTLEIPFNITPCVVLTYILSGASASPLKVAEVLIYPVDRSAALLIPPTTWFNNVLASASTGTSSRVANPLAVRKSANASLVGANTVKGPSETNTDVKFVIASALPRVLKSGFPATISTIVFVSAGSVWSSSSLQDVKIIANAKRLVLNKFFIFFVLIKLAM
ncbi:MAG: Uncharacterised protein [Flavobacteriaceae bacterium]|nr:MAG: Uncharacterised protein [Flavobacteriaceae bacterium]